MTARGRRLGRALLALTLATTPAGRSALAQTPDGPTREATTYDARELERALELLDARRFDEVLALLAARLQEAAPTPAALHIAGLALAGQGRAEEAARHFERALAIDPDSPAARDLGLLRGSQGRLRDCLRWLRPWFFGHPEDVEAGAAATYCALESYRAADARQLLERLPRDLVAIRLLEARLLLLQSKSAEALAVLAPALEVATGTMEVDARRLMAEAHLGLGQAERAVELLEGHDRSLTMALHLADAQFRSGDVAAALATLEPWARRGLATGSADGGAVGDATLDALRDYGRLLIQAGSQAEAIPYLEAALRLSPDDRRPWRLLGQALAAAGRPAEAEAALDRFRELAASEPAESIKDRLAEIGLDDPTRIALKQAAELAQRGRVDEAVAVLSEEAALVPEDARPHLVAARILLDAGRYAEAGDAARAAARAEPESPLPDYELARAERALGDTGAALAALGRALSKRRDFADALIELAEIELSLGRRASARRHLDRALSLEADHPRGRRLADRLELAAEDDPDGGR